MALNPRMVITDTQVAWDGGVTAVQAGTVVDCAPGSTLEAAYGGASNLLTLDNNGAQAVAAGSGPG